MMTISDGVMDFFLRGVLIGFLLAIPIGPTTVLCLRYTFAFGSIMGLVTGAGSGLADAFYGLFAGYGVYAIKDFMQAYKFPFHLIGSAILLYLGVKAYFGHAALQDGGVVTGKPRAIKLFITTFVLTVASPLTVLGVSALYASFGVAELKGTLFSPWILSAGLFVGSCLWWQFLSIFMVMLKKKISRKGRDLVAKVSGAVLFSLGIVVFIYAISLKING